MVISERPKPAQPTQMECSPTCCLSAAIRLAALAVLPLLISNGCGAPLNGAAVVIATPGDLIIHDNEVSVGGNTARFATGTCIYASGLVVNPCI
jgi:hypothetical protein